MQNPSRFLKYGRCSKRTARIFSIWFSEIEETPVASASIGQVHRAVLKDGTKVAVKIQRPGIGEIIETDISDPAIHGRTDRDGISRDPDL